MSGESKATAGARRTRITAPAVVALKRKGEPITVVTAYDFPTARLADEAGVEVLLVGDSGERDPELYATIARRHPRQVAAVAIRRVESRHSRQKIEVRLDRLARRLPAGMMRVFRDSPELAALAAAR